MKQIAVFISLIVLALAIPVPAQPEQEKEYVQVVNIEMILRVLKDGAPVGGLKKEDFSLSEDGQPCEINGFFENHRRITHANEAEKNTPPPRLYMLFFWVGNPAADVEGVLNKFFASIYREGDRVMLGTPMKTFDLQSPNDIGDTIVAFLEQWRREAKDKSSTRLQFHVDLNRLLEETVRRLEGVRRQEKSDAARQTVTAVDAENKPINTEATIKAREGEPDDNSTKKEINVFSSQYERRVEEYRLRELSPDMTAFETMARSLTPIKNDKFALVFFQRDSLPLLDIDGMRSLCMTKSIPENQVDELANAISRVEALAQNKVNVRILSEQLKSLFIQANIQFHLISLSPERKNGQANADSFYGLTKSEEVFSKWNQVLGEISKNTGGLSLDGDHMTEALDQVVSFEDIYYHITYVPRGQGAKKRQVDIQVNQPGMQVIYGRTLELKELPLVKITGISTGSQFIRLEVVDFYPVARDGVPTGFLDIELTGSQGAKEPPQFLLSQASETMGTVELPFAFPKPGVWELEARVTDQITGHQEVKKATVEVAAAMPAFVPEGDNAVVLSEMLAKAAAYAEKLKTAAFHFICREDVSEDIFSPGDGKAVQPATARNHWVYDYQIIARDRKIAENRVLLEKNGEKLHLAQAQLETVFHSYFSFYMPATLLAGEKQHMYQYRLLGREMINNKSAWQIAAILRVPGSIPWGNVWISEADGSVLKIQVNQTSIVGFEKLAQHAFEHGFMPEIATIHEYGLEKDGVRFPTRTTFLERYKPNRAADGTPSVPVGTEPGGKARAAFERSRTSFEYKDHLFFSVATSVKEKPE
jgi:hypothetical protein